MTNWFKVTRVYIVEAEDVSDAAEKATNPDDSRVQRITAKEAEDYLSLEHVFPKRG